MELAVVRAFVNAVYTVSFVHHPIKVKTDLGSGHILNGMSCPRFQHVHLGQDDLVVKLLELLEQTIGRAECGSILLRIDISACQLLFSCFDPM